MNQLLILPVLPVLLVLPVLPVLPVEIVCCYFLLDMIKQLCVEGLAERSEHLLCCAMLLARQAALEGAHMFPSYAVWVKVSDGERRVW